MLIAMHGNGLGPVLPKLKHIAPLIAHRGASAYAPENTLAAFNQALVQGTRAVEFDVMMNHEGELFIFHDETLNRTTNGKGNFLDTPSDTLKKLESGSWFAKRFSGEKILTLNEVLDWLLTHKVWANIELKPLAGQTETLTTAFLSGLSKVWRRDVELPIVSCFNLDVLKLCAHILPELPLGMLFHQWPKNWYELAKELDADVISLAERQVTKKRLKLIKEAGYKIGIYTVNSKEWATRYYAWGADTVFSDYPDLMAL